MPFRSLFRRVADERPAAGTLDSFLQWTLSAAAPVYGAGAWANRLLHETGVRRRERLPAIVLSVGNVTLGGTGKTPFTIWLAQWLASEGKAPAILSRGYGRVGDGVVIVHDGKRLRASTREGGDEPVMMAKRLRTVPVVVGAERAEAGRVALRRFAVEALVLDDGLQHVALERQAEIILLDATRPLNELRLFPRGTLREPLGVLSRAHLIVLTRCDQTRRADRLARGLTKQVPGAAIVRTRVVIRDFVRLATKEVIEPARLKGARVVLACGVGNPTAVRKSVEGVGATVVALRALDDHARPTRRQLLKWDAEREAAGARWLVVTEKDAVKLAETGALPDSLLVARAEIAFLEPADEERAAKVLRARLRAKGVRALLR